MILVVLYWSMMVFGYLIGMKSRNLFPKGVNVDFITTLSIGILVFVMGLRMGSNHEIVSKIGSIGIFALALTVIFMVGSVLSITFTRKLLGIDKWGKKKSEISVPKEEIAHVETFENKEEEKENNSNLATIIILSSVVVGLVLGYFFIDKLFPDKEGFDTVTSIIMSTGISILLLVIGFTMGLTGEVVHQLKTIGLKVLIFPIAIVLGTTATGLICSLIFPFSAKELLAIGYGFGWYTFAPIAISHSGLEIAGAISFLHNVFRELGGIVLIPLLAKKIGYIEVTSLPGVAAMDICMPIIERSTRQDIIVYSFIIGMMECLLVPMLVPLVLSF